MTDDQLRNVRQWEVQAGYPSGTFEAFGIAKPEAKILHTSSGTDAGGNQIVTFIYDDGTGKPGALEIVKTGGVAASTRTNDKQIIETTEFPAWEEYLAEAQKQAKMSFGPELTSQLREEYENAKSETTQLETNIDFTPTELKKLEAAGLLGVSRNEKLKFLYPATSEFDFDSL